MLSPDLKFSELKVLSDDNGRYILLYCMKQGKYILIINTYAPNIQPDQATYFEKLIISIQWMLMKILKYCGVEISIVVYKPLILMIQKQFQKRILLIHWKMPRIPLILVIFGELETRIH